MLSKKYRATYKDVKNLKLGAKRVHSDNLIFIYKKLDPKANSRLSCSASKKVDKIAARRNALKRKCREAIRLELSSVRNPVLGMVSFKKNYSVISFEKLRDEIRSVFSQIS
jgi:ribonuclease P protein component